MSNKRGYGINHSLSFTAEAGVRDILAIGLIVGNTVGDDNVNSALPDSIGTIVGGFVGSESVRAKEDIQDI
jgi:hypothetical protein